MTVYIVEKGYDYEGESIQEVFANVEDAIAYGKQLFHPDSRLEDTTDPEGKRNQLYLHDGSAYVIVTRWDVQ